MLEVKINCYEIFRTPLLTELMKFVSLFGDGAVPFVLTPLAAYYVSKKNKQIGIMLIVTVIIGVLAKEYFESLVQADRPFVYGCSVLTNHANGYSFPSGHVNFYVIFFGLLIFFALSYLKEKWAKILITLSSALILLVGYSRYYLGAHWISDILAGYIFGGVILLIAIKSYRFYLSKTKQTRVYDSRGYIQKAGLVVTRKTKKGKEVLLVYRKKEDDYSFPKGSIEKGESLEKAAARELREETGLVANVGKKLPAIFYNYPEGDGKVKVNMFVGIPIKFKSVLFSDRREKTFWTPEKKVKKTLTHQNLKDYWDKIKDKI